jgi:hypothetical protein
MVSPPRGDISLLKEPFMRRIFRLAAAIVVALAAHVQATARFEGKLIFTKTGAGDEGTYDYFMKGDRVRVETGGATMIGDTAKEKMLLLMPDQKIYMEMKLDPKQIVKEQVGEIADEMVATGVKDTIQGYPCEEWAVKNPNGQTEICLVDGFGPYLKTPSDPAHAAATASWEDKIMKNGGFPFRIREKDAGGKLKSEIVVTTVEKKKLSETLFTVPGGYRKFAMPDFSDLFKGKDAN